MEEQPRRRYSKIWRMPTEELIAVVQQSVSISDVRRRLGYRSANGLMDKEVAERIAQDKIDTAHFSKSPRRRGLQLSDLLVRNSSCNRVRLKRKLLADGLLENKCTMCGMGPDWNGRPLALQLDHMNGVNNDNRLENLRMLCPNCHSQTTTYAGRNNARVEPNKYQRRLHKIRCLVCESEFQPKNRATKYCSVACARAVRKKTKIEWPSKEKLAEAVWKYPRTELAQQWGVSDKAIHKRCKALGIPTPPRGYWSKTDKSTRL